MARLDFRPPPEPVRVSDIRPGDTIGDRTVTSVIQNPPLATIITTNDAGERDRMTLHLTETLSI